MIKNLKYSHNGYNPLSQEIINKKVYLKNKYSEDMAKVNIFYSERKKLVDRNLDEATFIQEELKLRTLYLGPGLKSFKEYSAACSDLKKGWQNKSLVDADPSEFSNTEIVGSVFSDLPEGVVNCILKNCICDNFVIPDGFTLDSTSNKQYVLQKDGELWNVDKELKPVSPVDERQFDKYGISKDPGDIPDKETPVIENAIVQSEKDARKAKIIAIAADPVALDELVENKGRL